MKWFYIVSQTFFMNLTMENPPWITVHLCLLLRNKLCTWRENKRPETFSVGQLSWEIWNRCIVCTLLMAHDADETECKHLLQWKSEQQQISYIFDVLKNSHSIGRGHHITFIPMLTHKMIPCCWSKYQYYELVDKGFWWLLVRFFQVMSGAGNVLFSIQSSFVQTLFRLNLSYMVCLSELRFDKR